MLVSPTMAEISIKIKDTAWFQQLCPVSFSEEQFVYYVFLGKKAVFVFKEDSNNNNNSSNNNNFIYLT